MKSKIVLLFLLYATLGLGQVGIGTQQPDPSAVLDIKSSTKGVLMPRLTTSQRLAIVTPAEGLQVYDTEKKCLMIFRNNIWDCYPDVVNMNSRIAAILAFKDIKVIGGENDAQASSNGVALKYNPDGIIENLGSGVVRFKKAAKYEITVTGTVQRGDGINVNQLLIFKKVDVSANYYCAREAPGSTPSHISYFCQHLLDVDVDTDFEFIYLKVNQGTPNTTSISVIDPLVIIKYIDLY